MLGIGALLAAPLWAAATLHAQACTTWDPPCPPPPTLSVVIFVPSTTVTEAQTTISFQASDISHPFGYSVSVTVDGRPAQDVAGAVSSNQIDYNGRAVVTLVPGLNTVTVQFCDLSGACDTEWQPIQYIPPPPVTREPNSQYRRAVAGCDGCLYGTLSYSTPSYRSLDQDRSVALVYSSALSAPTGLVTLDISPSTPQPERISVQLYRRNADGSLTSLPLTTGGDEVFYQAGPGSSRVTAQFDAAGFGTESYEIVAAVRIWSGGAFVEHRLTVPVLIQNERASPFGSGWSVAGLPRLRNRGPSDHLTIVDGAGGMVLFTNCGTNCWTPPPGEPSSVVLVPSGAFPNGVYERRFQDGSVAAFSWATGNLLSLRDRLGNTTSYTYDGASRLTSITDPAGLATTIAWSGFADGSTRAVITTPNGRTSTINVTAAGELASIVDPDGVQALAVTYSGNRIVTATDRLGAQRSFSYDPYGGLAAVAGPDVLVGGSTPARPTTTYRSREAALLPAAGTGAPGQPAAGPAVGWLLIRTPRGDSTRLAVNGEGNATTILKHDSQGAPWVISTSYDSAGRPISASTSDRQRFHTRVEYVWTGVNLTQVQDHVAGVTTDYTYNDRGQRLTTVANGTTQETNVYSADSRSLLQRTITGNDTTHYTYDARGRVAEVRDGGGHRTAFTYQSGGFQNTASTLRELTRQVQFGYDLYGRQASVTNPLGQITRTEYDLLNRVTRVVTPDGLASTYTHNDATRTYTFTDPKGQSYTTTLDARGAVIARRDPRLLTGYTDYDEDGNVSGWRSRAGRTGSITYDALSRPIAVTAGTQQVTLAYDTARKWTAYHTGESTDTIFVDGAGRVEKQVTVRGGQRYELTSGFGELGVRRSLDVTSTAFTGTRSFLSGVDTLGRPDYVGDFAGKGTAIAYNKEHQPSAITLPTGTTRLTRSLGYDWTHAVLRETHNVAPGTLDRHYNYDALDRITGTMAGTEWAGTQRLPTYDVLGRLSGYTDKQYRTERQWVCPNTWSDLSECWQEDVFTSTTERTQSYTYDAVGNRTDLGGIVEPGNRQTSYAGYSMTYDADGNLLTKVGSGVNQSFTWNALGQLEAVTNNLTGAVTTFGYDGLGRRVRKTVNGVTTSFLYHGDHLLMQLDGAGQPVLEFSYYPGADNPHAVRRSSDGAVFYYTTEQPGHVTALVNTANQVVNTYKYTPFGEPLAVSEQVAQPLRFTAREYDGETGLYYYRARYYDPQVGRFISEDPAGLEGGVNPYAYAANSPVNFRDPTGRGMEVYCPLGWDAEWVSEDRLRCTPPAGGLGGLEMAGLFESMGFPDWWVDRVVRGNENYFGREWRDTRSELSLQGPKYHNMIWRPGPGREECPARILEQFWGHHGEEVWELEATGTRRWSWKQLTFIQSYGGTWASAATGWKPQGASGVVYCWKAIGHFQTPLPPGW